MNFILENEDFDIKKIFESGQNFSYNFKDNVYSIQRKGIDINIETKGTKTYFNIDEDFFNKNLYNFFDMNTDYKKLREEINKNFPEVKKCIEFGRGLRFLNGDFIEVSTSFIISQNNNIKRIKKAVEQIIELYGKDGNFPSLDTLKTISQQDLRKLGIGFRDEYLYKFYDEINEEKIKELKKMNTKDAFIELNKFRGIGPKVANCILLFGLGKRDVFPIDTHIKKIMQDLYFDGKDTSIKKIEEFALDKYGEYASYIQQYLFYYSLST